MKNRTIFSTFLKKKPDIMFLWNNEGTQVPIPSLRHTELCSDRARKKTR